MKTLCSLPSRQRGSVLLVAMVMLLTAAILAAAAFRGSITSTQVIGNMQWRNEAITAANDAIDRLLSSADFATNAATVTAQVNAAPFQVDINGDGVNDISTNLPVVIMDGEPVGRAGPRCLRAEPIPSKDLDPGNSADLGCFGTSGAGSSGLGVVVGGAVGTVKQSPSLCSNTEWSITVQSRDVVTNTSVEVVQGVGVRVLTTAVPVCN